MFRSKIFLSTTPDLFVLHIYVCVHVFPRVSASVWGHMATYITMRLEARRVSLSGSLLSFPSQYLSPNTEVASAASPNSQPAPGPISASHLVLEIGFQAYLTFLCGCW